MEPHNDPGNLDSCLSELHIDVLVFIFNAFPLFYVITKSGKILQKPERTSVTRKGEESAGEAHDVAF